MYREHALWSPALDRHLSEMRAAGLSFSQAAECIGCSKNAVAGRIARLGLRNPRPPSPTSRGTRPTHARAEPRVIPKLSELVILPSLLLPFPQ
jgi:hypothetical protein